MATHQAEPPDEESGKNASPSTPNSTKKTSANNTPRRGSIAKHTPNGNTKTTPNATATPTRKTSTQNKPKTPNTAPARAKTGVKKSEPTLLGDFLLGRPSPARTQRRKSLNVVKTEMRADLVGKVQPPGGVKDRVKTWQKASAAEVIVDPLADAASQPDDIGGWENDEDGSVDEEERLRIKFREGRKTALKVKRKEAPAPETAKHCANAAPKKRVISDSHWMKNKKKSPPRNGTAIPKNFLQTTAINPPLEKKISDWVKRTESQVPESEKPKDKPRSRKASKQGLLDEGSRERSSKEASPTDGIRIRPSPVDDETQLRSRNSSPKDDGIRITPSKRRPRSREHQNDSPREDESQSSMSRSQSRRRPSAKLKDDGIRVKSTWGKDLPDDGIRIKPSRENSVDDSIRIKPTRKKSSKKMSDQESMDESEIPRKKSGTHLRVPSESGSRRKSSQRSTAKIELDDDAFSHTTPSPPENRKRRKEKAQTPPESLAEVPFGNSAFSVVDLPLGAEAGNTVKRSLPKRNPSFGGVPKALKKVFNEGMKMAHDAPEPARGGQNQPPSIESWLKGTSDPFVDKPTPPASTLEAPESEVSVSRQPSYKKEDQTEKELTAGRDSERDETGKKQASRVVSKAVVEAPAVDTRKAREQLPSMATNSPPMSPGGLKRTPATRNTSSPKSAKKLPLKDAFMDAFRGESSTSRPRSASNPFIDITGLREREINSTPTPPSVDHRISRDFGDDISEVTPRKRSPRVHEKDTHDEPPRERAPKPFMKRAAPTTGAHRLSTIASIETFSNSSRSSATGTLSELSQTTITQDTVITGLTDSCLSRNSKRSNNSGLKRRLTKHSDLVSVLSLPDAPQPGRKESIKSARSIRTNRNHLDIATIPDLMRELGEDETKYMRELKTLVDGVIPVLLTCVLSKSNSAIAAGLFNPNGSSEDNTLTKPIVDMGVALERLKSSHKRIPLTDADAFILWAQSVHRTYQDYLIAWRAGFQDVVVNLEPASNSSVDEKAELDDIARDENGDAVGANGQRADVAYFLKRPLVRVKNLARVTKGLSKLLGTEKSKKVEDQFQELSETVRRRYKEENARLEDENANNTDPTRARDPRTLDLVEGVEIDRTRQVCARDIFHLDLQHSAGQRVGCRVEVILRDKPQDPGDVLICEMDDLRRFLLFPPVSKELLSARRTEIDGQLVVMIRGSHETEEWNELLLLEAEDPEAGAEWIDLLGSNPLPPPIPTIINNSKQLDDLVTGVSPPRKEVNCMSGGLSEDAQVPIGERLRREAEERANSPKQDRRRASQRRSPPSFSTVPESIKEESAVSEGVVDLNDAMNKAGALASPKRPRAARYHDQSIPRPTTPKSDEGEQPAPAQTTPTRSPEQMKAVAKLETRSLDRFGPRDLPYIPKVRSSSSPSSPESTKANLPLKESMRPESAPAPSVSPPTTPTREDGAPPPPVHRTPKTPNALKNVPTIESPTPRALNRRGSSPLKHEYQPSADGSKTSSASSSESDTDSDSDSTGSYSDSESEDEELEAADISGPVPVYGKRVSPSGSIYSLPNTTLAPSNSASQGPYRSAPVQCLPGDMEKHVVMSISFWNEKGQWIDIYTGPCSVVIGPGWLRAYKLDGSDNNFTASGNFGVNEDGEAGIPRPLIGQELTPNVSLQRHTIDIHVRSPPMAESSLKCKGSTIRYHMLTPVACVHFYQALYESCKNNMTYNRLEEERRVNAYGTYGAATPTNRRNSWFGRRNSYRASARAPSDTVSEQTGRSSQSKLSALRSRLSGGSIFNIAKSSIDVSQGGHGSGSTSLGSSEYSGTGITPPRTPTSMWSGTSTSQMKDLGSENIRIRLYHLATATKWEDKRYAFLTVTPPPPGRRPNSTLHHGLEKHIIVTRREHNHKDGPGEVLLDEVLGSHCFQMVGVKGVMATIWDDIRDEQGMVGQIGAKGGVSGRQRKLLFQMGWVRHANWVYGLCAAGR